MDSLLVTVVGRDWYPSIRHEVSLKGLKRALEKRKEENMSYGNLAKIKEFFLKHYLFEFNYVDLIHGSSGKWIFKKPVIKTSSQVLLK